MAATESDVLRDEQERNFLLSSIVAIESAIAAATPGTKRILENTVENARKRVTTLDKKIEEAKVERATEVQAQAAAAAVLAAKETKLNASEQETYRGFLEEAYFTKKDFGRLDEFYTHSYDRLSEGGKEEISERLHEGIKRGEYRFSDLSQAIQRRDNAHCSAQAARKTAHVQLDLCKENFERPAPPTETTANKLDLSSIDLKSIQMTTAISEPSASAIPNASGQSVNVRTC